MPTEDASRSRATLSEVASQADVSVAYHAKPVVRAQATHAPDHCGLDAVMNLFA